MNSITITAPAKINLTLDVTGRRADGYHTISSVMQSVSLSDSVFIEKNNSGKIYLECKGVTLDSYVHNTAYKAATAFCEYADICCTGLYISIDKHIPLQAGLGGGSADAAAVIVGLNELFGTRLSLEQLCDIGAKIGADVPFCIAGGTKLCRSIGDEITSVPPLENCFIVIAKGKSGISTKEAYAKIDSLETQTDDISMYDGSLMSVKKIGRNIFEQVTENEDVPKLKKIIAEFGAEYTAMSGSGSAVFGLFALSRQKSAAIQCADLLKSEGFFAEVCIPLSHGAKNLNP